MAAEKKNEKLFEKAGRLILGKSKPVIQLLKMIERVAESKANILIIGESGTGKELVARTIHDLSLQSDAPFVAVNCGAIPETLFEGALFGHKKGSFTGAVSDHRGFFEAANGGTLFLDEIGEVPLSMQVKLLRALQERVIKRVGANEEIKVDLRIIAATNRDLEQLTKQGTFREDLYYRLNVIQIKTPPLRERNEDILYLSEIFLKKFSERQSKKLVGFSERAKQALLAYQWPGNIRELENLVERAVTLETTAEIQFESLPAAILGAEKNAEDAAKGQQSPLSFPNLESGPIVLAEWLEKAEKFLLVEALRVTGKNKTKAASLLGLSQKMFSQKIQKYNL